MKLMNQKAVREVQ